jgi:hypothetical protein
MSTLTLTKKITIGCMLGLLIFSFFATPLVAHAEDANDDCELLSSDFLKCVVGGVLDAIKGLFGWLATLIAEGIRWFLTYSTTLMSMPAVRAGFNVCLSIVNVLFVMALIIMAFQMILGFGGHETKSMLTKVIISALIVNFSFLIAGLLLDVSNVFTDFFISPVTGGGFANALGLNKISCIGGQIDASGACSISLSDMNFFLFVVLKLFQVIMTGLVLVIVIAVFGTVVVRTIMVAGLLMVMPLVWGLRVFPGLSEYSNQWWSNFMKWGVTVLPTMTFFLWLALQTANKLGDLPATPSFGAESNANAGMLKGIFDIVIQLVIMGGIMIFGLKVSQHAGGISASATISAGRKMAGFGAKAASFGATATGARWLARKTGANVLPQKLAGKFADAATGSRVGRMLVPEGAAAAAQGFSHSRTHALEEEGKKIAEKFSAKQLANLAAAETGKLGTDDSRLKYFMALKAKGKDGFKAILKQDGGDEKLKKLAETYMAAEHLDDMKAVAKKVTEMGDVLKNKPKAAKTMGLAATLSEAYRKVDRDFDLDDVTKDVPAAAQAAEVAQFVNSVTASQIASIARANGNNEIQLKKMVAQSFADQVGGATKAAIDGLVTSLDAAIAANDSAAIAQHSLDISNQVRVASGAAGTSTLARATGKKMQALDKVGSLAATTP